MILYSEDAVLEAASLKVAQHSGIDISLFQTMGKRGFGHFTSRRDEIVRSSSSIRFVIVLDGDALRGKCAGDAIKEWFGSPKPKNITIRFAFQEAENWLLADRDGMANFLGIPVSKIPIADDKYMNAKEKIVALSRGSRNRSLRDDILPQEGHTAKVGPAYNLRMIEFISEHWNVDAARACNESLDRACAELCRMTF